MRKPRRSASVDFVAGLLLFLAAFTVFWALFAALINNAQR